MIESLILSLILTIIIEISISLVLGIRKEYDICVVLLVNICTNPIVVYISNCIILLNNVLLYNSIVVILEIIVIIVEFELYKQYLVNYEKFSLVLSIINNALSFGIGIIINNIL